MERLSARLANARHARFVGREAELSLFAGALASGEVAALADPDGEGSGAEGFVIAHVYGPGGIGKTALLDEVARLARAQGVYAARVDGRDVEPSPEAFTRAARRALAAARPEGATPEASGEERRLLLIDTYEEIERLDGWLRRSFLPELNAGDLVVIAGRQKPSSEWRVGWGEAVAMVPLGGLAKREAEAYLDAGGVPEEDRSRIVAFAHGHPLALALAAERQRQHPEEGPLALEAFDPTASPDLMGELVARFVSSVPSRAHQEALESASIVQTVTVSMLSALLGGDASDAAPEALFAWLRSLSFVESDAQGIRLHDVVRETLEADLRWRNAEQHEALLARARRYCGRALRMASGEAEQHKALRDYLHLYRNSAVVKPFLSRLKQAWSEADLAGSGPMREGDADAIRAMVEVHQGAPEAETVGAWVASRPDGVEVFRRSDGTVAGFLLGLTVDALSEDERASDPVVARAWRAVSSSLRAEEQALLFRSWMDEEEGQGVSAVQSLVFARTVARYLSTPSLAVSFLFTTAPDLWAPVFAFVGLRRWREAEAPGGPAAFGKDWRAVPPEAWLESLASGAAGAESEEAAEPLLVLNRDAFAEAVREALKAYARPHDLTESPLLRARVVREASGDEPIGALRGLLREAAAQLESGPRDSRYFRALDLTYFRPAPTQAIAAERLDLPFSTYRRHLGRGVDHVVEDLWRRETGG
ncbi:ATP-binding protein [Rubricoccus marinus]|uniref:Uncharacterized protein n=1 Tax=Rubricoccus marinus TaxID=716817 RepID=A0A259TVT9_9BACT|nr:ATP-binding protein [Rubricoccus marinus]OZC01694.1 hypothetical protein BSZ36_01070 [Rubricoccus marinus]